MGEHFPAVKYREVVKVARKLGFSFYRQAKGSHEIWRRSSDRRYTTIPRYSSKVLKRKTFKAILGDLDISVAEFRRMIKGKRR